MLNTSRLGPEVWDRVVLVGPGRPTGFQNGEGYFGGLFPCLGLLAQLLFFFEIS